VTEAAQEWLTAFDTPSPADQQQVAAEILRRTAAAGELPSSSDVVKCHG